MKGDGGLEIQENRLDTDGIETAPLALEDQMLILGILTSLELDDTTDWNFDPDNEFDSEEEDRKELPWIVRMIRKRIIGEGLKIEITKKAYFLIMVLTYGNPGKAMFILHKIGNFFEKTKDSKWLVNSQMVTMDLFPFGFPTEEAFNYWWDNQKVLLKSRRSWSDNLVDVFPDEWLKS